MVPNNFNDLVVVKRSGQRVDFNGLKIAVAIKNAFDNNGDKYNEKDINKVYADTIQYIIDNYSDRKTINVEDIQDIIETVLKKDKYLDVFKSFSDYRIRRAESRKAFSEKQQHKFVKAIEKIGFINSKEEHPDRLLYKFGTTISNEYTKSYVLDNKYVRAHEEGKIYIHDLAYFNLGYIPSVHLVLDNILKDNDSFYDLLTLLLEAKKEVCGYIAIDSIDKLLSEFTLEKFKKIFKETIYNYLNVSGFLPLVNYKKTEELINRETTININLEIFENLFINEQLKIILKHAYQDSLNNIKKLLSENINKLLQILDNAHANSDNYSISLASSKTEEGKLVKEIFIQELKKLPRLKDVTVILKIEKDTDLEFLNKISELIESGKNIKISYIEASYNIGDSSDVEYFSNGLRIFERVDNTKISTGRANIANTSINMARLGLKHRLLNVAFYQELDELLELVRNELVVVFENIGDKTTINYQVLFNQNILDDEKLEVGQKIRKVIKNGTLNFNLIGLKECAIAINKENFENTVFEIVEHINKKIKEFEKDSKFNFTLSLVEEKKASIKLLELDKAVYGLIDGVTKKDAYSNFSFTTNSIEKSACLTGKLQTLLTGGNTLRIVLPKNASRKKIINILSNMVENDIGFASLEIGSDV